MPSNINKEVIELDKKTKSAILDQLEVIFTIAKYAHEYHLTEIEVMVLADTYVLPQRLPPWKR